MQQCKRYIYPDFPIFPNNKIKYIQDTANSWKDIMIYDMIYIILSNIGVQFGLAAARLRRE